MKIIDAKGKKLGRVASQAASLLIGKDSLRFARNIAPEVEVHLINAGALDLNEKRVDQKQYVSYSGYPGGLKKEAMKHRLERRGIAEIIRQTVYGMLPKNKLRAKMIKNLKISK
ncbi:MAG: 50S ribosomal protein L13 [Candidatus Zambryskibacteria bacterium RIFCSPHIGHO2_01_FULL_43_25]|uniref:50S ribosomal protein L13 n=1 Tax=Candidatus Zambryskibacteria bacterium RIFCSPLOWO2_01_FULL_45_21 TaxID=1802761 RepID=A0A1G2U5E5_9BACT|nr:MAG: 50S ribosomal protein L13 [Candidatus Zambryskibacteria bacterium RIFCSPHIGHO2_01_FULL_43_25]OHB04708.1 MAG: 50S ribosomal protein L13 [Candidatus Zambryskibacteria bacterium RIFCSPLOWO2_01_FULL_45_21]